MNVNRAWNNLTAPLARILPRESERLKAEAMRSLSDARKHSLLRPPREERLRRFLYGVRVPFEVARAIFQNGAVRSQYLRVCGLQVVVAFALTFTIGGGSTMLFEALRDKGDIVLIRGDDAPKNGSFGVEVVRGTSADSEDRQKPSAEATVDDEPNQKKAKVYVDKGFSALYGLWLMFEWIVIALSRDYHDEIGRQIANLVGVPPEDPPIMPRVRLNVGWLLKKAKRRFRGIKVLATIIPVIAIMNLLPGGHYLYAVLMFAWTTYWLIVFVAAKSALAWKDNAPAEPWFLRRWNRAVSLLPGGLQRLPRAYGRLWARLSNDVFSPAQAVEKAPYEFSGLGAARLLSAVPFFYTFLRPILPVAAAYLLSTSEEDARPMALME